MTTRPPLPPFTREAAIQKVRLAEDGWNTRDAEKVSSGLLARFALEKPLGICEWETGHHRLSHAQMGERAGLPAD
jgi:Protein of unknown function (DUF1348)